MSDLFQKLNEKYVLYIVMSMHIIMTVWGEKKVSNLMTRIVLYNPSAVQQNSHVNIEKEQ